MSKQKLPEKPKNEPKGIVIPPEIVESLLVTMANSNRVGTVAVCEQIREMAQEQMPEVFPK